MPCETVERDERKWDGAIENANIWVFVWISINKTHMHIGSRTSSCYAMLWLSRSFFLMLTNGIYYSQTKFNQYTLWFQRKNEFYPKSKVEFQPIYIYTFTYIYIISRFQPSSWQPVSENMRFPVCFIRYLSITFV